MGKSNSRMITTTKFNGMRKMFITVDLAKSKYNERPEHGRFS
ncbi:hypothetical protein T02_8263 [Trichinella nativa]|uniref:Uncharacterized protein n=1 Tax=Trichinella nativa TaxID=6335 RepID=A0A0V1JBK7_9BILA|nr:hypothetical protein T02_8263 [Trichinella nativa]